MEIDVWRLQRRYSALRSAQTKKRKSNHCTWSALYKNINRFLLGGPLDAPHLKPNYLNWILSIIDWPRKMQKGNQSHMKCHRKGFILFAYFNLYMEHFERLFNLHSKIIKIATWNCSFDANCWPAADCGRCAYNDEVIRRNNGKLLRKSDAVMFFSSGFVCLQTFLINTGSENHNGMGKKMNAYMHFLCFSFRRVE